MKKVLKQLAHINVLISETKSEIKVIRELPFYSQFRKESERELELSKLRKILRDYYSQKQVVLENLELAITKSKIKISTFQKELTLLKETA